MRVGIFGLGRWGQKVLKEYIALLDEEVIESLMLYDHNFNQLKQLNGLFKTASSFRDALNKVDVLHICTDNSTHYSIAKQALQSGIHVLVEKPMTTSYNQALELVELADSQNLILQAGHIYRFSNVIRKIVELFQEGFFGTTYYFTCTWTHLMPIKQRVDILWDLLPHPLDILNFITEKWPTDFIGAGRAFRRHNLKEIACLQALFNDDIIANIHLSWLNPFRRRILEVIGSKKTASVECVAQHITIYDNNSITSLEVEANNTLRAEILNFIDAVKTGKNHFNSSLVGARNVEMIEKAVAEVR